VAALRPIFPLQGQLLFVPPPLAACLSHYHHVVSFCRADALWGKHVRDALPARNHPFSLTPLKPSTAPTRSAGAPAPLFVASRTPYHGSIQQHRNGGLCGATPRRKSLVKGCRHMDRRTGAHGSPSQLGKLCLQGVPAHSEPAPIGPHWKGSTGRAALLSPLRTPQRLHACVLLFCEG
jgi:hypothetical protein